MVTVRRLTRAGRAMSGSRLRPADQPAGQFTGGYSFGVGLDATDEGVEIAVGGL